MTATTAHKRQRLLVSVRGKKEALEAVDGGAHIVDVEYPASALGTPYPLNIRAVRGAVPARVEVSTNIGETQLHRGTACQAALGVALAGADIVKAGLAKMHEAEAAYLARSIVRTLRTMAPSASCILAFFADPPLASTYLDPLAQAPILAKTAGADGVLVDTFDKSLGNDLLDYVRLPQLRAFAKACHTLDLEAWIAGSITLRQAPSLWDTGVDVICVRAAACNPQPGNPRFGQVSARKVSKLVSTIRSSPRRPR